MNDELDFAQLERESEQLRLVLSLMAEGFLIVHEGGAIAIANQAAGVLVRTAPEDAVGEMFDELFPLIEDTGNKLNPKHPTKKALEEDTIIRVLLHDDWYLKRQDGTQLSVTLTATPFTSGHQRYAIVLIRDASEEKSIDRAKTEFVSLASHQLKTPLSAINWFTEMLLSGDAGHIKRKQRDYLEEIHASAERMTRLVNDLLNVSRIELGTFSVDPKPIRLESISKNIIKELAPQITQKEQKIIEEYSTDVPEVSVDNMLMRIIFQNLLSNAVKYTPKTGTIRVAISNQDQNLLITVTDSGMGIPNAQKERIFSKFFRADNAMGSEVEGTGLGLYLVKSILEETGGTISFSSKEDIGTTFTVTIPLSGMQEKVGNRHLS